MSLLVAFDALKAFVPFAFTTQICPWPDAVEENAIYVPSGDHVGPESGLPVVETLTAPVPFAFRVQT